MIDEKKLIKELKKNSIFEAITNVEGKNIYKIIEEQPKIEWIPVEERLPEPFEYVLVWFEYFRYGEYNCLYQTYGISYTVVFDGKCQFSGFVNCESGWQDLRILAWQPLPKPYKGVMKDVE